MLGYALRAAMEPRLFAEYNYSSGDANPHDSHTGTFDQLYPTGHDKLGLADQVGWRNTHHLREGFEFSPVKATPISVNYQTWWLAEKTDGLYAANGNRIAFVAGGAASSRVGQEIDVQVTRALTPQLQLAAGYAHMFAGDFLKQTGRHAIESTTRILRRLEAPELKFEDPKDEELRIVPEPSTGGGYDPYNQATKPSRKPFGRK